MKKCFRFFSLIAVLISGSLFAHIHPCPGGWAVDAEFVYLFPTVDDTYFVIDADTTGAFPTGTKENNDFGFHPGFRVGGVYAFCGCDCPRELQVYYTRLRAKEDRTISGTFLWATLGHPDFSSDFENFTGSARSELDLLYHRVDAFYAQQAWCGCGLNLYLQAGLEFAYIRLHEDYEYRNVITEGAVLVGDHNLKSKTWGIGPQFGLDFHYDLCEFSCWCCPGNLSLITWTSASLLASRSRAEVSTVENPGALTIVDVSDHHTWRLIPAFHARVGLNYQTSFCGCGASLEVGYEFNSYLRAVSREIFCDDVADSLAFTNYYNFDVQGLYIALAVSF